MVKSAKLFLVSAALFATAACYHATVETGLPAGNETVEKSFAAAWIYGLVPPSTVSTAARCRTGVARVETQLSFVNMLVGDLTLGIFTPMSIKVTCAAAHAQNASTATQLAVRAEASPAVIQAVFATAAAAAASASDGVAYVNFVPSVQK